ncbi:MAG: bifunctional enoyl-CoA hydratase/phosphate acetyltransferase [Rhodospirillales bacterium]|nr:bifunctional enoyl-CoA hydratase/phosphate acetyltransferase [Rhodospirillales bacterium]
MLENRTFDEIRVGDTASVTRALRLDDVETWAAVTGNVNLTYIAHLNHLPGSLEEAGASGMWGATLLSTLIGMQLPGLGSITKSFQIEFRHKLAVGTQVTATVIVVDKREETGVVILDCRCADPAGRELLVATAEILAPREKVRQPIQDLPLVQLRRKDRFRALIERSEALDPLATAVVHPCSEDALVGAVEAAERNLITPILVGPERKIRAIAESAGIDITPYRLVPAEHSHHAAELAVELVRCGNAVNLMKGSLHTDELLHAILKKGAGLRTERRLSHCFCLAVSTYERPIMLTDAAINIAPDLVIKRDICQNAIELAQAIGYEQPKVAILAAVETVDPAMPATIDAAALCKMADRGQITGGIVDGPLAFDNAVDLDAARTKGIVSPVAGMADILVVPDLEAGNMLAKQLTFMADAEAAGLLLGARVPVVLTSRADSAETRLASCALSVLMADAQRRGRAMLKAAAE